MGLSFGSLYHLARNGMMARQLDMNGISNNLANVHTPGYKQTRINFQEVLVEKVLGGVASVSSQADTTQGALLITENPMDWAIEGEGYFAIKLPNGETGYTRDGSFTLDKNGSILTSGGLKLDWTGTVPANADLVNIDVNGTVKARVNGDWNDIGTVQLASFINPGGLRSYGSNIWLESEASGTPTKGVPGSETLGYIRGYVIEQSNVNMTQELTKLIRTQRGFESASRALQKTDEMVSMAIRMRQG